jgi:DNA-binding transcriptional LysR family regulator
MRHARLSRLYRSCSLTQIAVFEAVARLGSITRAAEEICLAQPTVSLQMKRFAESLGAVLFHMNGRRLELTEAGREVHRACDDILQRLAALQARITAVPALSGEKLPEERRTQVLEVTPRRRCLRSGRAPARTRSR